mmetsp:Transcript_14098/g.52915  ORF Transcript_14098/g.52915 Transcript_14098/m.52915 type:complete len:222 (-) Transcript_14098:421-1086(-)
MAGLRHSTSVPTAACGSLFFVSMVHGDAVTRSTCDRASPTSRRFPSSTPAPSCPKLSTQASSMDCTSPTFTQAPRRSFSPCLIRYPASFASPLLKKPKQATMCRWAFSYFPARMEKIAMLLCMLGVSSKPSSSTFSRLLSASADFPGKCASAFASCRWACAFCGEILVTSSSSFTRFSTTCSSVSRKSAFISFGIFARIAACMDSASGKFWCFASSAHKVW